MTLRVACIGEAMIELSMNDGTAAVGVAGDTLNTAIYLKRAAPGIIVDYITRLGDDPFSARISEFIADAGIGTGKIGIQPGGRPGLYAITLSDRGERSFTYWRNSSAARGLFGDGDFSPLEGYDLIYLSGISIAILPQRVRLALLRHIQAGDMRLAFDSNYRPNLWETAETAREMTAAFWDRADIALPSLDDEMALFGEAEAACIQRLTNMACAGAIKRGAMGPLNIGSAITQDYAPAPRVVDTTAAGDSFNAGYLAAILAGQSQAAALAAGHDLARRVVARKGAIVNTDDADVPA